MKKIVQIIQSEAAECGLVCLAMVIDSHGLRLGLPELRRRFPLSLKGARLNHIINAADHLGFQARPLRLEMEAISQLVTPCILHWNLNHFVVLSHISKQKITLYDPALGKRELSHEEVSHHFTGVALELIPSADFTPRKAAPSVSVRQLTGQVSGLWPSLTQVFLLSVVLQVFALITPFYMQWIVDQVLVSADRDLLVVLGIGFMLVLLLQIVISLLRGWSVVYLSSRLGLQWMGNVFAHALKLPLDFFEKRHLGDITSRMASVQSIQRTLTTSFVEAIIDGLMAAVTLGMMLPPVPM